jgi:hypothetical protein
MVEKSIPTVTVGARQEITTHRRTIEYELRASSGWEEDCGAE